MTDSNIFRGRLSTAAEVAEAGYRAFMRGDTSVIVGLANKLLVFSLRFSPRDVVARVSKRMMSRAGHGDGRGSPAGRVDGRSEAA
jgi:short-subunit dehydrogenase